MLGNKKFLRGLGRYLKIMEREGKKMNAPVYAFEDDSRETPFEILIYTMLSARTKDETTVGAARRLFARFKGAKEIADADVKEIEQLIKPVGFYRIKAKHLKRLCAMLIQKYNNNVPHTLHGLTSLPGVGIKTAHIVLARAFGHNVIGVDTHVHRISNRLGLVRTKTPEQTSRILNLEIPKKYKNGLNRIFVGYGQAVCKPTAPKCNVCPIRNVCPRIDVKHS